MRVWLENDGHVVMGARRMAPLAAIEEHHSIRRAAASLDMSYRRAWLLVQSMNAAAGKPLVEASKGGMAARRHGRHPLWQGGDATLCQARSRRCKRRPRALCVTSAKRRVRPARGDRPPALPANRS